MSKSTFTMPDVRRATKRRDPPRSPGTEEASPAAIGGTFVQDHMSRKFLTLFDTIFFR